MSDIEHPDQLRDDLRTAWHRYVDMLAPLRPELHRYCRRLARNVWDAEDLLQDSLLRAFGHLGFTHHSIRNPKAYLLRTATNVWIDTLRRREAEFRASEEERIEAPAQAASPDATTNLRDAGARLIQRLSPQERAAVTLKEFFDMSLEEIAELLATTTGAVKAALHRGRERLRESEGMAASRRPLPSPEIIDRFIDRYHAKDMKGMAQLMLDGASMENVGESIQVGRDTFEGDRFNILYHVVHGHEEWPPEFQPDSIRALRVDFEGEPLLVWMVTRAGQEAMEVLFRFEEQEGQISRIRTYTFCPETMREVGKGLGVKVRTGLYRAPTPAPGKYWPKQQAQL